MLHVEALSKSYGDRLAVDAISFTVAEGETVGLLGPNGAGKTTTLRMLTTLLEPSSGSASVVGYDLAREPREVRRRIGYVPQLLSADGDLTAQENMMLSARLSRIPAPERRRKLAAALERRGLTEARDRLVDPRPSRAAASFAK